MRSPEVPPPPTPSGGRLLPRRRPGAAELRRSGAAPTVVGMVLAAGVVTTVRRTVTPIRRLREAGARVPALVHDTTLAGTGAPLHLVVLGDSAAAGHGLPHADVGLARQVARRLVARTGRPVRVTSHAVDGATTLDVLERQVLLAVDAGVVLVGVGVNDAVRGRSPARIREVTDALLRAVRQRAPGASIVLLTCPDLGSAPGLPPLLRPLVRRSCRRVAAAQRAVAEPLGVALARADGHLPAAAFGPDGFHPGPQGVATLADRVIDALGPVVHGLSSGRPTAPASRRR